MPSTKVDNSLKERRDILDLIGRLKCDGISIEEMEQIGLKFRRAGKRALRPLVRELWRERSGELIAKYAYVLDFFDTASWLDQLIQIAVKRRDLGEDGKAALFIALEGYGVDVGSPPFSKENTLSSKPLHAAEGAIKLGDEGIVTYLDDFLSYHLDAQELVIRELSGSGEPQAARMLEAMLWHDDTAIVRGALTALGRVRYPLAAGVLSSYLESGNPDFFEEARRSLRRLSFLGIHPPPPAQRLPFHSGYATPPDGDGYRSLVITRWVAPAKVSLLYMQIHERRGLLAAWGAGSLTEEECQAELECFKVQDDLYRVSPEYVLQLMRDALHWSRELCHLPADFYLRRGMFSGEDITPVRYTPSFDDLPQGRQLSYQEGEEISRRLFADPFFSGWFMASEKVYDLAVQFRRHAEREEVLQRFCAELLAPEIELIRDRLLMNADLMRRCGRDPGLASQAVALAGTLADNPLPFHLHPFLRVLAQESLETAREAMEQGESETVKQEENRI